MFDIDSLLALIFEYRYIAIFCLAFAEGPVVSLILGFLVSNGTFELIPTVGALVLGDLLPDTLYYYAGRTSYGERLFHRHVRKISFIKNNFHHIESLWKNHPQKTMFFAKLAYGFSTPFLISAGLIKMKLKRFLRLSVPVTFFQYGILFTLGYWLGDSYNRYAKYIAYSEYIIAAAGILIVIGYILFIRYSKNAIVKLEKEETE